jgi:hypothetical protein
MGKAMLPGSKLAPAVVGFRVKSGWAAAVLLSGPVLDPRVLDCRSVSLSDPRFPESRQPYHARMGTLEEDSLKISERTKIVQSVAKRSIVDLLRECAAAGHQVQRAALVVGSQIDPALIKNPHIRAHALEGRLFKIVLEEALRSHDLSCLILSERNAYLEASAILRRPEEDLRRALSALGHSLGGPWRVDQKMAALAAWIALR